MLSTKQKQYIATVVQSILQGIESDELPKGEIDFILHIDGEKPWSWANIRNNSARDIPVPEELVQNLNYKNVT